jgi:predicted anti-sigma-YlaC factor YlaD
MMKYRIPLYAICFSLMVMSASCSINRMATKMVANALTGVGNSTVFTGDPDPELVGDAIPLAIKVYEALLEQQPDHQGLILTTGSLFIMYANAFVQGPAQMLPSDHYLERQAALDRAKKLYLRGADILYTGLDKKYPGFSGASQAGTMDTYLAKMKKADVPSLYWLVAGRLSAFGLDPFNIELGVKIAELTALIGRAYELDPDFNNGALDDFYVLFYSSLPEILGGNKALVETHFKLAVEKSKGLSAGPYVSYAQSVCVPAQDYETFKSYLEQALAIDVDQDPAGRLQNILSQRTARYLLDSASNLFISLPGDDDSWYDDAYEY